jgi:hypothetical protein
MPAATSVLFADSVSGDLLETTRILFDEDGELRDFAGAAGSDLLYFTSLSAQGDDSLGRVFATSFDPSGPTQAPASAAAVSQRAQAARRPALVDGPGGPVRAS